MTTRLEVGALEGAISASETTTMGKGKGKAARAVKWSNQRRGKHSDGPRATAPEAKSPPRPYSNNVVREAGRGLSDEARVGGGTVGTMFRPSSSPYDVAAESARGQPSVIRAKVTGGPVSRLNPLVCREARGGWEVRPWMPGCGIADPNAMADESGIEGQMIRVLRFPPGKPRQHHVSEIHTSGAHIEAVFDETHELQLQCGLLRGGSDAFDPDGGAGCVGMRERGPTVVRVPRPLDNGGYSRSTTDGANLDGAVAPSTVRDAVDPPIRVATGRPSGRGERVRGRWERQCTDGMDRVCADPASICWIEKHSGRKVGAGPKAVAAALNRIAPVDHIASVSASDAVVANMLEEQWYLAADPAHRAWAVALAVCRAHPTLGEDRRRVAKMIDAVREGGNVPSGAQPFLRLAHLTVAIARPWVLDYDAGPGEPIDTRDWPDDEFSQARAREIASPGYQFLLRGWKRSFCHYSDLAQWSGEMRLVSSTASEGIGCVQAFDHWSATGPYSGRLRDVERWWLSVERGFATGPVEYLGRGIYKARAPLAVPDDLDVLASWDEKRPKPLLPRRGDRPGPNIAECARLVRPGLHADVFRTALGDVEAALDFAQIPEHGPNS